MAKSKWLEAQHALKRNSLRKDNPHIRILTHFTHSRVFFFFTHSHSKTTIARLSAHTRVNKLYKYSAAWTVQSATMTHAASNSRGGNFVHAL